MEADTVGDEAIVGVNRPAVLALISAGIGMLILLVGTMLLRDPTWSMAVSLVGAGALVGGYLYLPPLVAFFPMLNAASFLLLLMQSTGICKSSCGGFVDYAFVGPISTAAIGCGLHFVLTLLGVQVIRRGHSELPSWYAAATAVGIGASLFFLVIMVGHQHWCPSCASVHACMVAQAVMLVRIIADRGMWVMTIVVSALGANALFHHSVLSEPLAPGDRLLGWLATSGGSQVAVATLAPAKPADSQGVVEATEALLAQASIPTPEQRAQAESTLEAHTKYRTESFAQWGDAAAPVVVRYHLSLVCPGCRSHWADLEQIRPLIDEKKIRIEFIATWPIKPETHYGAQLGAHVLFAAGLTGEDELLAAADRLFSADGLEMLNTVHAVLLEDANTNQGAVSESLQREALVRLFQFIEPVAPQAVGAFKRHKPLIDAHITSGFQWLLAHSKVDTPRYHFLKAGTDGAQHLSLTTVDAETWGVFAQRTLANAKP